MNLSAFAHNKQPMRLNSQAIGGSGSVRPAESNSLYFRQPYQSLDHVLETMKQQVQKWKGDQQVRQKAVQITRGIGKDSRTGLPDRRNYQAIAEAIYSWMKKNIAYVRDPDGIELLQSPLKTIEYGNGDCDDHSILAASLLSSLGVPVKFKVVKANPYQKNSYSHIYVVYRANGQWNAFDTTLHAKAGSEISDSQIYGQRFVPLNDAFGNKKKGNRTMIIQQYEPTSAGSDLNTAKDCGCGCGGNQGNGLGEFNIKDIDFKSIVDVAAPATGLIGKIFGGKSQSSSCKQRQAEIAQAFSTLFTQSELYELAAKLDQWESSDHGANPEGLAYEYIGGKNCKIENDGKRRWVSWVNEKFAKKQAQMNNSGSSGNSGGYSGSNNNYTPPNNSNVPQTQPNNGSGVPATQAGFFSTVPKPVLYGSAIVATGGLVYLVIRSTK